MQLENQLGGEQYKLTNNVLVTSCNKNLKTPSYMYTNPGFSATTTESDIIFKISKINIDHEPTL